MSIHRLVKYLFTVLILVSYIGLVLFSISSNKEVLQKNSYWDWYRNYVSQSSKGTFVNTGSSRTFRESRLWDAYYAISGPKRLDERRPVHASLSLL